MKRSFLLAKIFCVTIAFILSACSQKSQADNFDKQVSIADSQTPTASPTPFLSLDSPIRKIDFNNFTYPANEGIGDFTLENGEKKFVWGKESGVHLGNIEYVDITGDGEEDAILVMSIQTGGSAIPNAIFIYTIRNNKTKLLWNFVTGDRADGGLKKIYAENGELIIELFGESKLKNGKWIFSIPKEKDFGAARPAIYTRNRFKWNGRKFVKTKKPELFDYSDSR